MKQADPKGFQMEDRLVRLPEIIGKGGVLPVSRATFYGYVKDGKIPKPIKLGERISAWRLKDILDFINQCEGDS